MSYAEEQWVHHNARMARIEAAGLMKEYRDAFVAEYDRRIPDPHSVGNMAEAVISDGCKIAASAEVCYRHGLDMYECGEDDYETPQLSENDQMILRIARTPIPRAEAWQAIGQDVSYAGFNHRCDRLIRAGVLDSYKQFNRRFIKTIEEE